MGSGQTSDQAYNRQRTLYKQADKSAVTEELVEREAAREETVEETQNDEEITAEERKAEDSTEEEYENLMNLRLKAYSVRDLIPRLRRIWITGV